MAQQENQEPEEEQEECEVCKPGAPLWMATFADLMTLLMCFFVLLLSFAEIDAMKFKRLAGSLNKAFGVQREVYAVEIPKGTSIIAQEFSPARPDPTPINEVKQHTLDITQDSLEVFCFDPKASSDTTKGDRGQKMREEVIDRVDRISNESKEAAISIATNLEEEITSGLIDIEMEEDRIIIRINEKGSFRSGSDYLEDRFFPVLDKLRNVILSTPGKIAIVGHTDDINITTARFKSNWALSAARAVTILEELTSDVDVNKQHKRFLVEGKADTQPLVPNDSEKNRAINRRIELVIMQTEHADDIDKNQDAPNDNQYLFDELTPDEIF